MATRMHKPRTRVPSQRGMSLVELMISLGLGATLMAGVVGVFVSMYETDFTQDSLSRMQEAGRFALDFMGQDLRMAGFLGCSSTQDKDSVANTMETLPDSFDFYTRNIQGWDADGTDPGQVNDSVNNEAVVDTDDGGWVTSGTNDLESTNVLPGTDIFRVWRADPVIEGTMNSATIPETPGAYTVINVSDDVSVSNGEILLISDCERAVLVQACQSAAVEGPPASVNITLSDDGGCSPGNVDNADIRVNNGAQVLKLGGTLYFVGKLNDVSTNPPSLFRRQLGTNGGLGDPELLVEGVEDMQILYGENTDNDGNNAADTYVPADQVTSWGAVVSVRISLLVMSVGDNLMPSPVAYTYNGVIYNGEEDNGELPNDNRLRRVFTSTINLRNITLGG